MMFQHAGTHISVDSVIGFASSLPKQASSVLRPILIDLWPSVFRLIFGRPIPKANLELPPKLKLGGFCTARQERGTVGGVRALEIWCSNKYVLDACTASYTLFE